MNCRCAHRNHYVITRPASSRGHNYMRPEARLDANTMSFPAPTALATSDLFRLDGRTILSVMDNSMW
jgi:hypothetical protein